MQDASGGSPSRFVRTFPRRFATALADAQGAIAGIAASAEKRGGGLIDAEALGKLHELYRLRIELELETAGVLWRTAELVAAMADALELLGNRSGDGLPVESIEGRRAEGEAAEATPPLRRAA
jgi:hypothetical protein